MKVPSVLKHISHCKTCKNEYTDDELQKIKDFMKKRKHKIDVERQKKKYDPIQRKLRYEKIKV